MLDLKALNESFNRINLIKTSGKLFEDFCEDCSESGIEKEDILDWLSEHEQLWNDCEKHFVQDPTWLSADELEGFICDHDQACQDYSKAFGLSLGECLKEALTDADMDECLGLITDIIYKYYINDLSKENVQDLLGRLEAELYDQIDFTDQMRAENGEDLEEGKSFDFNKLNKKIHGNIRL